MKKIVKAVLTAAVLCVTALAMSLCVSAETEDVELSVTKAKQTNGAWGQSVTYDKSAFDCSRITPDTIVEVEFELEKEWAGSGAPVEFVLQNYSTADPAIWAKVVPFEYDDTSASFQYEDMVTMYGSDDFSTVDAIHLGDCGIGMKVTKFTIKNCEALPETTTTTTAAETTTTTASTTESVTEAPTETTAAEETTTAAPAESESGGIPIILIVIIAVVVATAVVTVIIIVKHKKRFY